MIDRLMVDGDGELEGDNRMRWWMDDDELVDEGRMDGGRDDVLSDLELK